MKEINFIHCADLHLDSPFVGLQYMPKDIFKRIQESTFKAFSKVIEAAISLKVDFVIISGDLYDGEDRSIKAQARLRNQLERLERENIDVFIVHGNHDHLSGGWSTIEMPKNTHIFPTDVEVMDYLTRKGIKVHLYGFSYPQRHVKERKIDLYKKTPGADLDIGILHGHCEGGSVLHQPYAPFSIVDLIEKEMDYWALGHIHKQQILHIDPYIVYPGNIQGRNPKEQSTKGCYAVTLSKNDTEIEFIETADILWDSLFISAKELTNFNDLFLKCKDGIEAFRKKDQAVLLQIQIQDTEHLEVNALEKIRNGELLEVLQDGEEQDEAFVWTYQINQENTRNNKMDMIGYQSFKKELEITLEQFENNEIFEEAISELYSHIQSRRYLEKISVDEKEELLMEANQLISQLLNFK